MKSHTTTKSTFFRFDVLNDGARLRCADSVPATVRKTVRDALVYGVSSTCEHHPLFDVFNTLASTDTRLTRLTPDGVAATEWHASVISARGLLYFDDDSGDIALSLDRDTQVLFTTQCGLSLKSATDPVVLTRPHCLA